VNLQVPIGVAANICDVSVAVRQEGLMNVSISDLDAQIPVAVAANVCDLDVAVLAELGTGAAAPCDAAANPVGTITVLP
jgi:hypothetical protein